MSDVMLYGRPRSVYVQMAGIVLTHHEVAYAFHDLETEMNTPAHRALHPFERVPILRHGDFVVYETSAIVGYVDEVFGSSRLTPGDPQLRAHMNQWVSAVNGYYYPYLIYHVSHERNVFRISASRRMKPLWRTPCPRSKSAFRCWSASCHKAGNFCLDRS